MRAEGKGGDGTPPRRPSPSPLTPASLEPLPFAPKTKMEAPSRAGAGGAAWRSGGRRLHPPEPPPPSAPAAAGVRAVAGGRGVRA